MAILIIFAVGFGLFGLVFLSQATSGVGLIAFGCLLAICARIAQAASHHSPGTIPEVTVAPHRSDTALYIVGGILSVVVLVIVSFALFSDQIANLVAGVLG